MPLLENMLVRLAKGYDWPPQPEGASTYKDLVEAALGKVPSYRWCRADQRDVAADLTDRVIALARLWGQLPDPAVPEPFRPDVSLPSATEEWSRSSPFVCGAPRPRPALRIVRDF